MTKVTHPATYSDPLLPVMAGMLKGAERILDPFAGTGKLVEILGMGVDGMLVLNELEPEWADIATARCAGKSAGVVVGDARRLPFPDGWFDAVATSPTYGNRMADTFVDDTKRITYTAALGRDLSPGSTGCLGWGPDYRQAHREIWAEVTRVAIPGAVFAFNASNFIAEGEEVDVVGWHVRCLEALGWVVRERVAVPTRRHGFGANREARVAAEQVICLTLDGVARPFADLGTDVEVAGGKVQLGMFEEVMG